MFHFPLLTPEDTEPQKNRALCPDRVAQLGRAGSARGAFQLCTHDVSPVLSCCSPGSEVELF